MSLFRALAASANYLAQDRPDIQYAVKEVARRMSRPRRDDWLLLKRLARYLVGAPRAVLQYGWQHRPELLDVFVDADWAGCKPSLRSTSAGTIRHGWHTVKTWSTTQTVVKEHRLTGNVVKVGCHDPEVGNRDSKHNQREKEID